MASRAWRRLEARVSCTRCGEKQFFHSLREKLVCAACGKEERHTWSDVLLRLGIGRVAMDSTATLSTMGGDEARAFWEDAPGGLQCFNCSAPVKQEPTEDAACAGCAQVLGFEQLGERISFYALRKQGAELPPHSMVALKCASCNAPLEADVSNEKYHCSFCNTDNVLPPQLKYKYVFSEVFVSAAEEPVRGHVESLPEDIFKSDAGFVGRISWTAAKRVREERVAAFTHEQLNQLLLLHRNDSTLFDEVVKKQRFKPAPETLTALFKESTNWSVVLAAGQAAQVPELELDTRLVAVERTWPKIKQQVLGRASLVKAPQRNSKRAKEKPGSGKFVLLVVIATLIALAALLLST